MPTSSEKATAPRPTQDGTPSYDIQGQDASPLCPKCSALLEDATHMQTWPRYLSLIM